MMRRLRYTGERVPLPEILPKIVALLCAPQKVGSVQRLTPVGTGFFVGVNTEPPGAVHWYLVTARHIAANEPRLHVRLNMLAGGIKDHPTAGWVCGGWGGEDVAVAPFDLPNEVDHSYYPIDGFVTERANPPWLGDLVYFVGMLNFIPEMSDHNLPMVRSGTLGALDQANIPVRLPGGSVAKVRGHLIDCRAYRGFSGSPCFVQGPRGETSLLGVVSAHFDAVDQVPLEGDLLGGASAQVPIHAGVGVIAPVEILSELLADERLVEMRKQVVDEYAEERRRTEAEGAATLDSATDKPEEFQRFEDLTRKLTQVRKPESGDET